MHAIIDLMEKGMFLEAIDKITEYPCVKIESLMEDINTEAKRINKPELLDKLLTYLNGVTNPNHYEPAPYLWKTRYKGR